MSLLEASGGLLILIAPLAILIAGLGLSHFMPSKNRLIGIVLLLVGVVGSFIFGIGFFAVMARESAAATIALGALLAVELATLAAGVVILKRKKSPLEKAVGTKEPANEQLAKNLTEAC
jgi:hypothetical protein